MNSFEIIQQTIRNRRSARLGSMNGNKIEDALVSQLLELADWAPTHAHTEPWRFIVYSGEAVKKFGSGHAELYKSTAPEDKFSAARFDKLLHNGDNASHIIVAAMKRNAEHKIALVEEIAATACAVQNILLGAEALGIATFWSTGGLAHDAAMKKYLGLSEEDMVLGFIYLGYTSETNKTGKRLIPLEEKVQWFQ
jgi:nitroreductase